MQLRSRDRVKDLGDRVGIVAILNVTPDSYYDGGELRSADAVVDRARKALVEGADILEIGGESTGPGSGDVPEDEETARVIPAVEAVRRALPGAWIGVDTWKASVARRALGAGADLINDVTAGRADAGMFPLLAEAVCPFVMMYAKDPTPRTTVEPRQYDDVLGTIHGFLRDRIDAAQAAGVRPGKIIVDPGLGHFVSADPRYSFAILRGLKAFLDLGPVLVSPSRKSFLAGPAHLPPKDRLPATLEATVTAVENGARFIRTHDVSATRRTLDHLL